MYELLYVTLVTHIIISATILTPPNITEHFSEDDELPITIDDLRHLSYPRAQIMRCSRRFTPGVCAESRSVWTYVYNKRNCVERLGCPYCKRTNRFKTYHRCMSRCRPLDEVYAIILRDQKLASRFSDNDEANDTNAAQNGTTTARILQGEVIYRRKAAKNMETTTEEYEYQEYPEPLKWESSQDDVTLDPDLENINIDYPSVF